MATGHDAEARELVRAYADRIRLTRNIARAERPTGAMVQEVFDVDAALNKACEAFRRSHYPRSGRVFVGLNTVLVGSPAGRRHRSVYDGSAEFAPATL